VDLVIEGDVELLKAFRARLKDLGTAINLTVALKDPIADVAGKTVGAFSAIGDLGLSGAACFAASLQGAVKAQASISVSVSASASVSGSTR
jgi:hypothetical protein